MSTMAREQEIEEVLNHLKDVNVKTITLWGKEGVGKTWTARSVMHRAIKENLFDNDSIIWITVGRGCGGLRLIWKIAQELSFVTDSADYDNDEEESMESMVERISASLMGKRFFLILDDIDWSSQNFFDELGIPYPDGQNGSKILITRSDISVDIIDRQNDSNTSGLKTAIDGDVSLHLNSLSEEDALKLFHEKKCIKVSQHINILVQHVVEKCEHLPLVIVVIAGALKDINDSSALKDALDIAVNSGNSNSYLQLLQFGYNMLPSDSIRNCFLYFATLTSEVCDIHYNELVTYWIMEGLIDEFGQIEETYEKGHAVLRELIDRGMIQQRDDHVSMHYLIRKMALHIIDKYHCKIFAKAGFGLTEPLKNGIWRSFKKITLMDYVINAYNSRSKIYNPCALLLEGDRNGLLREIPKAFFLHMQRLQFLALLQVKTKLLPSSLSGLEQLHVLLLRKCDSLKDVSTIQGLRKLVVLDFSGCKALKEIPDGFFDDMHYLQVLDLSETSLKQLPPSLSNLTGLRQLFLKGCLYLEKLPSLEALRKLKVFDLSDAASIKEVGNDNSFNYMSHLQVLNLSGTAIEFLPELCNLKNLYQLLLANCSRLRQFPQIKALEKLEVLDVSDASTLSEVPTLDCLPNLKVLNFSGTSIQQLPFFHNDSMLHQLLLRGCTCLKSLQHPRVLVKLELLDLTDTKISNGIQDESFWFMPNLQILYLSKSFVKELPSFLNLMNLRQLFLTKCSSLTTIPPSEKLTRLEVLDLSGAKALRIIDEKYFDHMISLQILKLSGSQIGKLPSLSMLRNLTELLLSGCPLRNLPDLKELTKLEKLDLSHNSALTELQKQSFQHLHQLRILNLSYTLLESVPDLKALTKLEQLDLSHNSALMELQEESFQNLHQLRILNLSYTLLESLPSISELTNLQKLLLKCCSRLVGLPSLRKLSKLEVLDLSGTKIVKFPYETSELTCLKQLDLLCLEELGDVDWGEITWLPEVVNWDYNISNTPTGWPDILVSNISSIKFLEEWFQYFPQFHFSICGTKEWDRDKDLSFRRTKFCFRELYFRNRHFPDKSENCQLLEVPYPRSLELIDVHYFPSGIEMILIHTELLSLKNCSFITRLLDLGAQRTRLLKECWIEKCHRMDCIDGGQEAVEEDVDLSSLEKLWVSNVANLRHICEGNICPGNFSCLRCLHLECCPRLVNVFSSTLGLENLEILVIKFCDKIENIFGQILFGRGLPKLQRLFLWELPLLKTIYDGFLPSLHDLKVRECPELKELPLVVTEIRTPVEIRGELSWWNNLIWRDERIKSHICYIKWGNF